MKPGAQFQRGKRAEEKMPMWFIMPRKQWGNQRWLCALKRALCTYSWPLKSGLAHNTESNWSLCLWQPGISSPVPGCFPEHSFLGFTWSLSHSPTYFLQHPPHPQFQALPFILKLFHLWLHFLILVLVYSLLSVGIYPFLAHNCFCVCLSIHGKFSEYKYFYVVIYL